MIIYAWAVFFLLQICTSLTLPRSDSISNPPSSNLINALSDQLSNLSFTGHNKDTFEVPGSNPVITGVVAWPMPRSTFTQIVVETCIQLLIQHMKKFPGGAKIIGPQQTECYPLIVTLWPVDKPGSVMPITYKIGIAVLTALNRFIADTTSYGNLYTYVFKQGANIANIDMSKTMGSNITTSDNATADTQEANSLSAAPFNISTIPSNSDQFHVPGSDPLLKGIVAWPLPRFVFEKDTVTKCVRALAGRMKTKQKQGILADQQIELYGDLMVILTPLHNISEAWFMTYHEAALVLTFFNQFMSHTGSYGNFYVYIFRDDDCIGTIDLRFQPISSNTTSDTNQVSVT